MSGLSESVKGGVGAMSQRRSARSSLLPTHLLDYDVSITSRKTPGPKGPDQGKAKKGKGSEAMSQGVGKSNPSDILADMVCQNELCLGGACNCADQHEDGTMAQEPGAGAQSEADRPVGAQE